MTADGCGSWKYNWRSDCAGNDRANSSKVIGRQGHDKLVADTRRLLRATWYAMRCWPRPLCMVYATLKSSSSPTRQKSLGNFVRCWCSTPKGNGNSNFVADHERVFGSQVGGCLTLASLFEGGGVVIVEQDERPPLIDFCSILVPSGTKQSKN